MSSIQPHATPPVQPSDTSRDLFVAIIEHKHGSNISAHHTEDGARSTVLAFVSDWWDQEVNDGREEADRIPMPEDRDQAIAAYFEAIEGEHLTIEQTVLID